MNQSPQSIPSRHRKCCRCNGVNARCKFCACATSLPLGPAVGLSSSASITAGISPSFQLFPQVQQTLEHVEVTIPGSIPSCRPCNTARASNRKQYIVSGCQELLAPTMWQNHMTLHARGLFLGAVPNFWLEEQDLHCCASCHQLVANSRSSSHSQR